MQHTTSLVKWQCLVVDVKFRGESQCGMKGHGHVTLQIRSRKWRPV